MQDTLQTLQTENAKLRRELEDLRASSDSFLALASHDLQGPLRKIVQSGEILHMDAKDILSEDNLYFLNAMNASAQQLRHLIFDLLKYIDLPRIPLERVAVDLTPLVWTCVDDCLAKKREENSSFNLKAVEVSELPIVWADKESLEMLFKALLDNSFKFTNPTVPVNVSVRSRQTDGHIQIDIVDNGIGIIPVTHVDIFDPFIRLNEKSAYKGSGLGLSVSRLICDRHAWALDYQKDSPDGTVMTISLPLTDSRLAL